MSTRPAPTDLSDAAIELAERWVETTAAGQTPRERRTTGRLAALVGHGTSVEFREGEPIASLVALREVARPGGASQFETTVVLPSDAAPGLRSARAAGRRQLEALTAVKRAGAGTIVTYWAKDLAGWL